MKVGRLVINMIARGSRKSTLKRRAEFPPYGKYEEKIDIPYIDDGNYHHKFDVVYGKEPSKHCCIIDIHGGSYIFGEHQDQYIFGDFFLKQGYDFVAVDYVPNDGTRKTKDIFDDLHVCFNYIFSHWKELGLEGDDLVITGDSAGGHMALTMAELLLSKEYAAELGYSFPEIKLIACLANCPVYDFVNIGVDNLAKSGMKRMFGPTYVDKKSFELLCPRTHIDLLTCPTFVSTCRNDFIRQQSVLLNEDMKNRNQMFEFFDVNSKDKKVGHVHNVLSPFDEEGTRVNQAMVDFIEKVRKL